MKFVVFKLVIVVVLLFSFGGYASKNLPALADIKVSYKYLKASDFLYYLLNFCTQNPTLFEYKH